MTNVILTKSRLLAGNARQIVRQFAGDDNGATAIEYGLIVSLIGLVILAAMRNVGESNSEMYDDIVSAMQSTG